MPDKKVAIIQSNYIPWKGYFDMINSVDEFIILDEVQYTRSDWRNRNLIKTKEGVKWLILPVKVKKERFETKINEVVVADKNWGKVHWATLTNNYRKAPYFKEYSGIFESLYLQTNEEFLSLINFTFISAILPLLGIQTKVSWSTAYTLCGNRNERLVYLCQQAGAKEYLSGPAAKGYIDEKMFKEAGISVSWMDYSGYPEYNQLYPPFEHGVTVLDLIFNEGPKASQFMKSTIKDALN
ncbi:WbqC family protein [Rhodocytophaga rosea]|uniref:WbqC family protein n=1 Tax=Rhodocytophaga rosea TaxID=2704465 RepID=A0A6C0GCM3_9BACT|nr:WbqC family protein [Rhodocytophaga rosea]QHT65628.1 WbqC family protein [Rhodocytophaga rosea]